MYIKRTISASLTGATGSPARSNDFCTGGSTLAGVLLPAAEAEDGVASSWEASAEAPPAPMGASSMVSPGEAGGALAGVPRGAASFRSGEAAASSFSGGSPKNVPSPHRASPPSAQSKMATRPMKMARPFLEVFGVWATCEPTCRVARTVGWIAGCVAKPPSVVVFASRVGEV